MTCFMKSLIFGILSLLLVSAATAPAVRAETMAANSAVSGSIPSDVTHITPFNLVTLAYQGYFREQGIPGYGALIVAHQAGRISAEDLVQSAARANKVSLQVLNNQEYLNAVKFKLDRLNNGRY